MKAALLIDFGSTYTKVRAVDLGAGRIAAAAQGPSTVAIDINVGLDAALGALAERLGGLPRFEYRLAASSAAGGLRMVTVGLVRELTAEAARQAALGAGAKLVGAFAYRLTGADVAQIAALAPDLLLLCGGTDGGDSETIVRNARALAQSDLACPIVAAGNREAADEVGRLLGAAGKTCALADNVMPALNVLGIESARAAIRELFLRRIVHAKGIDRARERLDVLMPTPLAVLEAAELLARGAPGEDGLGDLVLVDPGGATTDVHSIGEGRPALEGVLQQGLPEPYAKRTVEGDLGMRHSAASTVAAAGAEAIAARAAVSAAELAAWLARVEANAECLPRTPQEHRIDRALARAAIGIAVRRHAGTRETAYTALGPVQVQRGKDLGPVRTLIGTGGVLAASADAAVLLSAAVAEREDPASLRPAAPRLLLDRDYVLYAAGLLAQAEPRAALRLARSSLVPAPEESHGKPAHAACG